LRPDLDLFDFDFWAAVATAVLLGNNETGQFFNILEPLLSREKNRTPAPK
jgi:hypothetical protein